MIPTIGSPIDFQIPQELDTNPFFRAGHGFVMLSYKFVYKLESGGIRFEIEAVDNITQLYNHCLEANMINKEVFENNPALVSMFNQGMTYGKHNVLQFYKLQLKLTVNSSYLMDLFIQQAQLVLERMVIRNVIK